MRYLAILFLFPALYSYGQTQSRNVLFIGNSYTGYNDLPLMLLEVATSCGDNLVYDSNTPGGFTLQGHSTNSTTLNKISEGNWDYVVLQEQSQLPSFPISQVQANVFPYARKLDSLINLFNPCAETVFYMTWGRKNGDSFNCQNWPPVCTYEGMDSLLNLRYRMMADTNDAILSPVGAVWNYIRNNHPNIELYDPDESHPSAAGTFAAACTFYTTIYRNDPTLIGFNPGLNSTDAENIKQAVKLIVYQDLDEWHVGEYDPYADFSNSSSGNLQVSFTNLSENASSYQWDFGDGNSSSDIHPVHTYSSPGTYQVSLNAAECNRSDNAIQSISVNPVSTSSFDDQKINISFNSGLLYIHSTESVSETSFKIFNSTGTEVYSGALTGSSKELDLSGFAKGLYILCIRNKGKITQERFVKL